MRILRGLPSFPPELSPSVVALGAFDGIHLAHAKIIETAVGRARDLGIAVPLWPDRPPRIHAGGEHEGPVRAEIRGRKPELTSPAGALAHAAGDGVRPAQQLARDVDITLAQRLPDGARRHDLARDPQRREHVNDEAVTVP